MSKVSIADAAKLSGVTRQQLYRGYLDTGKISVDRSDPKKPKIDTSELLRVFGQLQGNAAMARGQQVTGHVTQYVTQSGQVDSHNVTAQVTAGDTSELERLKAENEHLKAMAEEKERFLKLLISQTEAQTHRIETLEGRWDRLLESKSYREDKKKSLAAKIVRIFGKGTNFLKL